MIRTHTWPSKRELGYVKAIKLKVEETGGGGEQEPGGIKTKGSGEEVYWVDLEEVLVTTYLVEVLAELWVSKGTAKAQATSRPKRPSYTNHG